MAEIKILSKLTFPPNEPIYRQGDISEDIFLIQKGTVEIYNLDEDGNEQRLNLVGEGFTFGEQALISAGERTDSARSMTDVQVVAVNRRNLDKQLNQEDPFIAALFRIIQNNMKSVTEMGKASDVDVAKLTDMLTMTEEDGDMIDGEDDEDVFV